MKNLKISILMTLVTAVLLGLVYPIAITGLSQLLFKNKANGELITRNGTVIGSQLIGQEFSGPLYFHSRPSAAGNGYDATSSGGSNLGPTSKKLIDRIDGDVAKYHSENPGEPVPIDLVTASASGLDPDITPAAALFQVPYIAKERGLPQAEVEKLVQDHIQSRQFGFLGEPRVNVLDLNLALDALAGKK